ncbi:CNH-domain-containing protein [Armillaria solidipes]|uniref:CNH-domain-containing protein n=1 Tax=Armillaria solidipes TaxID=1076256 RepID=A0A2H3C8E2_9AGAR|nr:CNH-domain-containing protein [Armillaria solidipes]
MDGAPDKRHAAYQSIFGRPTHHQPPPPPQYYPQYQDRRTSYVSYQQPPPPLPNAQYIYRQPPPMQYGYPYAPSGSSLAPPTSITRARSVASNPNGMGVIVPLPEEPPDPNLDALTRSGLTPAQAYQAQVYLNGPQRYQPPPMPQSRTPDPPRLGIPVDNSRLNVDFSNLSDAGTDDSSELPWARKGPTPSPPIPPHHHSRFSHGSSESPFPLHVDTHSAQSIRSSVTSASPSSFTMVEHPPTEESTVSTVTARRSSESAQIPRVVGPRRERAPQDRSMSMSAATTSVRNSVTRPPVPAHKEGRDSPVSIRVPKKSPIVYPALLSRVAEAFRDRINLGDRIKDGLEYKEAFDGREAVDKIAYIIKTTDRNLALLLGRALDAQKFFHDVTYDHRLRDSPSELYRFRTKLPSPFVSGELGIQNNEPILPKILTEDENDSSPSPSTSIPLPRPRKGSVTSDEVELPSGVFTLLTDCYSPTCSRDQLCYSIACPRRLEQQARLNMKPQPGLSKQISRESLGDLPDAGTLWIHSVPQEVVNSVSDQEKKRQEAINEVIYTERDFVRDMEYLRDIWIKRLQEQDDVIPAERRTAFLEQVFWNVFDIIAVNTRLRDALNKRQKSYAVVEKIGDILLEAVPHFGPFVSYGAHQLYGKYEFEKEKNANAAFAQFVETTERLPESRKLELNAYLTKPTTRLARYPLLLEAVLKHTPEDNPDKTLLPEAISLVREFLGRVNTESGKTENRFNLVQLDQALVFKPGEEVNLRLREEGRDMVYKGPLNKRDGEIQVYLFDHALLFTKSVKTKQHEQVKVYRRPIPLELLLITASEDSNTGNGTIRPRQRQGLVKKTSFNRDSRGSPHVPSITVRPPEGAKGQYWINFIHLGRKFYNLVLWSNSQLGQRKWLENIYQQQQAMRERSTIFETVTLCEGFFTGVNKVNCVAPLSGGRRMAYGTDDGIYISDLRDMSKDPVKVLALLEVMQIDVLEAYQLLIILSERSVFTVPLDALDPMDPNAGIKRAKRISSHTSFFKAGYCLGKMLVCIVKSTQLSSTFKTLEPIDQTVRGRSKPTFKKLINGGNDTLKLFREFYIPVESTSIHYLKTKMCVGCPKGFEIVDLETLDTQGLLDPSDESLEFVRRREGLKPMAIYRIQNEFLLCYDEFAFYVNKSGRMSRKDFMVHWEGVPTGFALHEPFVLAFEPSFVEIRHIDTGAMSQVIQGSNLRLLFADNPPSVINNGGATYYNSYPAGYGGYGQPQAQPVQYHPNMNVNQHNRNSLGAGRDEILMVSDDRVLALRTVPGAQRYMSDNVSMASLGSR